MRFIQIWILPDTADLSPQVEQKVFTRQDRHNRLLEVLSSTGGDAVMVHQDASIFIASLDERSVVTHKIGGGHGMYVYLIDGGIELDGLEMTTGDAAKVTDQTELTIEARVPSELILVEVPLQFEPVGIWRNYL